MVRVSISVTSPQGYPLQERLPLFSPESSVLWGYKAGKVSDAQYTEKYVGKLEQNRPSIERSLKALEAKYPGRDIALLCWCGPGQFCHRHILADWCGKNLGIRMEEFGGRAVRQAQALEQSQPDLFFSSEGNPSVDDAFDLSVAVVGSRGFGDYAYLKKSLDAEVSRLGVRSVRIVSGGARGADSLAEQYAREKGFLLKVFPADWDRYGKAAGYIRNKDIIRNCDLCVAFWDGQSRGTANDFAICREMNKPFVVFHYLDGRVQRVGTPPVVSAAKGEGVSPEVSAEPIRSFNGKHSFLSNFHLCDVRFEGVTYHSVEAAFQAAKCVSPEARRRFATMSPYMAKQAGRTVDLRPDWEDVKVEVMRGLLREKFAPGSELARMLLSTGNAELHEGNTWGDTFWGEDLKTGTGRNMLGNLLMEVRDGLRVRKESESFGLDERAGVRFYHGDVPEEPDVVFCFGSNPVGINGNPERGTGGAALYAHQHFGVRQGEKMDNCLSESGKAYGIVTVMYPGRKRSLTLSQIRENFGRMYKAAAADPGRKWCVAYRHLEIPSLCGYNGREMLSAICDLPVPSNVYFSREWASELAEMKRERTEEVKTGLKR